MAQDGSTFAYIHRNHNLPFYAKEALIFPYLLQHQPTASLHTNPDTDSYHDISSK